MSIKKYALFVISYNRLSVFKEAMDSFRSFFKPCDIFIIDKGSDYPPLLEYYQQLQRDGVNIIFSTPMVAGADGPGGLNDLYIEIDKYKESYDYYAITDPDISLEKCSDDLLDVLSTFLDSFSDIDIVGPMLKIDDIPLEYPAREYCYTRHAQQFWHKRPESTVIKDKEIFFQRAPIDSTFALLSSTSKYQRLLNGIRVYYPYEAKHLDWYIKSSSMTDDQKYYMKQSNKLVSHWGANLFNKQPFHHILTPNERNIYTTKLINNEITLVKISLPQNDYKLISFHNFFVSVITKSKTFKKLLIKFLVRIKNII